VRKSIVKWFVRLVIIDLITAVLVPLFQSLFDPSATFPILVRQFLFSVIYANFIGIPICLALPFVWSKTTRLPAAIRSLYRGSVVIAASLIGCLLAGLVVGMVAGPHYNYWSEFRSSFGVSLILSAIATSFVSLYESQQARLRDSAMQLKSKELEHERALKLATEARLSSLESRIHPHFLFNTINSVSSLIHEDPDRAERVLMQLAALLRFSLDSASGGLIPLSRELQIVEDYLDIEKTRFGPRLRYTIQVSDAFADTPVPPLSLQTLVENSVKYAVGSRGRGADIVLRASQSAGHLRIEVEDDGPGFTNLELPRGHGLDNLQERLSALYGDAAKLDIACPRGRTVVAIQIPRSSSAAVIRMPA
jgi:two-component system, LytTR family, sensor histidine kinase AlgZ